MSVHDRVLLRQLAAAYDLNACSKSIIRSAIPSHSPDRYHTFPMGEQPMLLALATKLMVQQVSCARAQTCTFHEAFSALVSRQLARLNRPDVPAIQESPVLTPSKLTQELEAGNMTTTPTRLTKGNPSFHLLITGATKSAKLCRTLLSATILGYPPPTLINYRSETSDTEVVDLDVERVDDVLHRRHSGIADHVMVLIAEGGSTIFQLPVGVLLNRFETTKLLKTKAASLKSVSKLSRLLRTPLVMFPEFDQCELPKQAEAGKSSYNPGLWPLRQRAAKRQGIDSGIAMGEASYIASLIDAAARQVWDIPGDEQDGLAELYAEQELQRSMKPKRIDVRAGWRILFNDKPTAETDGHQVRPENASPQSGQAELGMASDHQSSLFLSIMPDMADVNSIKKLFKHPESSSTALPLDIATAPPPLRLVPVPYLTDLRSLTSLALNDTIDTLNGTIGWEDLPLVADINTGSIPAVIHHKDRSDARDSSWELWRQMWFHPFARALLRNRLRSLDGPEIAQDSLTGGDRQFDTRGGKGGFWTDTGVWLDFAEVCRGYEDELFGDSFGEWGLEGGSFARCDVTNELYMGEGSCEELLDARGSQDGS